MATLTINNTVCSTTLSCTLATVLQVKDIESPTIINADYCTAPSTLSVYINNGIYYHGNYEAYIGSNYDVRDKTEDYSFSTYPALSSEFYNFMNFSPYRSVWVDSDCNGTKDALSVGNQVTIGTDLSFNTDKTIIIGVIGDNKFDINYDGTKIVSVGLTNTENFTRIHLFPIMVTAGQHYFTFTGTGDGSVNDSLGAIIWDNTKAELLTPIGKTDWNVLYSSEESLTESLDIVTCPEGYSYDNDSNQCVKILSSTTLTIEDYILVSPSLTCTENINTISWTISYGDGTSDVGSGAALPELFEYTYVSPDTYVITVEVVVNNVKTYTNTESVVVTF